MDMCIDMCIDMCTDREDTCIDVFMGTWLGVQIDASTGCWIDLRAGMYGCRHANRYA